MQAGHQEWTKTGSEPKAPVEPSKDAPSMLQATGGYVTSAMSWVAGSFIGKSANTSETTGTAAGTAATSEAAASEKQPKAVSSSTVNSVLPAITRTELSMEELEHLGEPSKPESTLQRMDSLEDDVWGEEGKEDSKKKSEDGWENEGLKAMGGWDDTGLNFSDEENKELEKESQNLEMIRQMAERMKSKSESPKPKKSEEAWEDDFGGTKKTRTRRATAAKTAKPAAKPTKISDDDLMAMLNDDKPLAAKNAAAKKASDGWDDWDEIKCPKCGYYDRRPSFPIDGFCPACGAPMSQKAANIILKRSGTLNEPLTWHELGSMSGKPVYIVYPEEKMGDWALVRSVRDTRALFISAIEPNDCGDRELYGETWLAYLRPPEMEALNNETD